jgi:hypothetical protein
MVSVEAVWTVRFGSSQALEADLNGGVAIIESGRIFGGDSGYAYIGDLEVAAQTVKGKLRILRHDPQVNSMYGVDEDEINLTFTGTIVNPDRIEGSLHRPGASSARLLMKRFAELP